MTGSTQQDLLLVIDMQTVFRDPGSQWCVPDYDQLVPRVADLYEQMRGRTVWTRFVWDPREHGSWHSYYQRWDECRLAEGDPAWDVTLRHDPADPVISLPTFSKWGPELVGLAKKHAGLVVCGVSTDCCVLSTVLGAVDAGVPVTVVTDACAGLSDESHADTLRVLDLLDPMVRLVTTDDYLAGTTAG